MMKEMQTKLENAALSIVLILIIGGFLFWWLVYPFLRKPAPWEGQHVSQEYYYCYDNGKAEPHHLGHTVDNDHYCTDNELKANNIVLTASGPVQQ